MHSNKFLFIISDKVFLLVDFSPQAKFECALKHPGIKIVTPDWITDSVKGNISDVSLVYLCIKFRAFFF